ncbi:hypothetical protein Nepgr_011562 [Nepenthes gracilis]|uniref:Uncharacterized protein n=1 Tax=Nepenthes gracilis TaxID=150966 RepID=A0AAD3XMH7_NEPGR|nr:hypothetical protein Nepgr_011562 [Nepenthes gracilis]
MLICAVCLDRHKLLASWSFRFTAPQTQSLPQNKEEMGVQAKGTEGNREKKERQKRESQESFERRREVGNFCLLFITLSGDIFWQQKRETETETEIGKPKL